MKRIVYILTAAVALIAVSAACNKVTPVDDNPASKTMTIKVTLSDAATRVTFDPAYGTDFKPTKMAHTWENGDQLRITDAADASKTAVFDLVDGAGTATGTFEGTGFDAASYNVEAIPTGTFITDGDQVQAKDGATDHLKFVASATGVTDLADFTLDETSGILAVITKLPAGVAATVDQLTVEITMYGYTFPAISVSLTTPQDVDNDDVLKVYANVPAGFAIPSGCEAFLKFGSTNPDHTVYTRYLDLDVLGSMAEGKFNYIKLNCSHIDQYAGGSDDGMEESPYLIADKYQMDAIRTLLERGVTKHFKMIADVDMTGITWVSLNAIADEVTGKYNQYISFDGNGHTLSNISTDPDTPVEYPSVFGVLNGSVSNLNIDHATITPGGNKAGVLAGYIGSGNSEVIPSVTNVHITNSTVGTADKRATNYVGGVAGQIQKDGTTLTNVTIESSSVYGNPSENKTIGGMIGYIKCGATLEKCHSAALVDARAYVGGIVGFTESPSGTTTTISKSWYDGPSVTATYRYAGGIVGHVNDAGTLIIQDCYSTGKVEAPKGWAGGLTGDHYKGVTKIYNCYATSAVSASFGAGGLVGQVNADGLDIQKCASFNASIKATVADADPHYSSGAIVAFAKDKKMTINTCYHKAGMVFEECAGNSGNTLPTSNSGISWLNNATVAQGAHENIYPYHGRRTTQSLIVLTRDTYAWDSTVWDFSGELPVLK